MLRLWRYVKLRFRVPDMGGYGLGSSLSLRVSMQQFEKKENPGIPAPSGTSFCTAVPARKKNPKRLREARRCRTCGNTRRLWSVNETIFGPPCEECLAILAGFRTPRRPVAAFDAGPAHLRCKSCAHAIVTQAVLRQSNRGGLFFSRA